MPGVTDNDSIIRELNDDHGIMSAVLRCPCSCDAVALFQSTTTPDSVSYEEAEDIVYERAKKTLNKAMEDFGGA